MTNTLETLSSRLLKVEDERAIERLIYSYGQVLDFGTPEDYAALFTPDAALEVHSALVEVLKVEAPFASATEDFMMGRGATRTAKGFRFDGHAGLTSFVTRATRTTRSLHVSSQPLVILTGPDSAEATTYLRIYGQVPQEEVQLQRFGRYLDRFQRTADGWRFSHRICEL